MRCPAHTIRSFDVRRSEAEGPLSGGQGNLVSLILLSGPREAIHESGMRENRTFRLSGGRRRALQWAPPPTRQRTCRDFRASLPSGHVQRGLLGSSALERTFVTTQRNTSGGTPSRTCPTDSKWAL